MSELYMTEVMDYVYTLSPDFLTHHGIKGQKWGRRRFQTLSGSLTAEGLKRMRENAKVYGAKAKRGINYAKLNATYKASKASVKGSNAAKAFMDTVSKQYSNKKIDTLDYLNRKGAFDLIDSLKSKRASDMRDRYTYQGDYKKRESDLYKDVGRISSYFNETSKSRSDKISSYLKNNSDTYFDMAKNGVSGARRKAMQNFETNLNKSDTGKATLNEARKRAVDSFASNMANMSTSELKDTNNWNSEYSKLGNRYVAEIANIRF